MALNKFLGLGRLTADPVIKQTQSGVSVCSFNIAVNRKYKSGEERKADFIPVVAWRNTAEFIAKYFSKGDPIQIEGRLETRTYEKDGATRFVMEVIADDVSFVEGAVKNNQQNNEEENQFAEPPAGFFVADDDEDLPFLF